MGIFLQLLLHLLLLPPVDTGAGFGFAAAPLELTLVHT